MDDDEEFTPWQRLVLKSYKQDVNVATDFMMRARHRMWANYLFGIFYVTVAVAYTCFPLFGASPWYFGTAVVWYVGAFFFGIFIPRKWNRRDVQRWQERIVQCEQNLEYQREKIRNDNLRRFNENARKELF